jgi:hypothetical protein
VSGGAALDLGDLPIHGGADVLLRMGLRDLPAGAALDLTGRSPDLLYEIPPFCRKEGHELDVLDRGPDGVTRARVRRGTAAGARFAGAHRAGEADAGAPGAVVDAPPPEWGLAPRGAQVEPGGPSFHFPLRDKAVVWADEAPRIYAQAAAAQWDPASAIPWAAASEPPPLLEDAVVQVMTYLVENETAALLVPARFLAQTHPHFREVLQVLAIQAADEARHIEVFTRRARLFRRELGLTTVGGQASLKTLLDEPDFALASFLLSVLGEGSFLSILGFVADHAPDEATRAVTRLAAQDEARHVAFGMAHLERHLAIEPGLRARLEGAVEQRYAALAHTGGLNEEVWGALVILAAGDLSPVSIARGHDAVARLRDEMHASRQRRLRRLGWDAARADELSAQHTRNFM